MSASTLSRDGRNHVGEEPRFLDFMRRPSLAAFLSASPNFGAGNQSGHAEKDSAK
jgi:hypothetical protein